LGEFSVAERTATLLLETVLDRDWDLADDRIQPVERIARRMRIITGAKYFQVGFMCFMGSSPSSKSGSATLASRARDSAFNCQRFFEESAVFG